MPRKKWLLPIVVVACIGLLGVGLSAIFGNSTSSGAALVYYTVKRGTLPIVVVERGNLESQVTEEVTCDVENFGGDRSGQTGTQILMIVPNGSSVEKGDLLVELDASPLKDRLDTQFLAMERAKAEKIQATVRFENQKTQNETAKAEAELRVRLAELSLESYEDETGGTFQIEMQNIEMDIQKARAQQMISRKDFEAVETLYDLGYKTSGDLASAKLALLRADSDLASQLARRKQLNKYTYEMEKLDRKGKHDTAVRTLEQVIRNNESELAQAQAAKESADRAYDKEEERYQRYTEQLEMCKIVAPQSGMVAYATGGGRYDRGAVIEEGAFVRERQKILTIPNLTQMQVNTAVHESVLDQVVPGLPATIRVDAFPDRSYRGQVKTVAVLPDQGGWMASDTKVYKTLVTIDEDVSRLKPGMTAVVEIDVEKLQNIISVPIQAIIQRGSSNWCFVKSGSGAVRRDVSLGKTNEKFVEIREGLQEGEVVVLNPMSLVDEQDEKKKQEKRDIDEEANPDDSETADGSMPADGSKQADGPTKAGEPSQGSRPGPRGGADQRGGFNAKEDGSAGPPQGPGGGKMRRGGGGGNLMQMDKNGDGKISKDEVPEQMLGMFDRFDSDGDGQLSAEEIAGMRGGKKKE